MTGEKLNKARRTFAAQNKTGYTFYRSIKHILNASDFNLCCAYF